MTPRITTALLFLAGVGPLEAGCAHSAHLRPELPALEMARFGSVAVDPANGAVVYVGDWFSNRGVFKSTGRR